MEEVHASAEELAGIYHQQMDYRQDDHEHENAVVGILAHSWEANSVAAYTWQRHHPPEGYPRPQGAAFGTLSRCVAGRITYGR